MKTYKENQMEKAFHSALFEDQSGFIFDVSGVETPYDKRTILIET